MDKATKTSIDGSSKKPDPQSLEELVERILNDPEWQGGTVSMQVRGQEVFNSAKPELADAEGVNARVRSAMLPPRRQPSQQEMDSALERMNALPDEPATPQPSTPTRTSTDATSPSERSTPKTPQRTRVSSDEFEKMVEENPEMLRGATVALEWRGVEVFNSAKPELRDAEGVNARVRSAMSQPSPERSEDESLASRKGLNDIPPEWDEET